LVLNMASRLMAVLSAAGILATQFFAPAQAVMLSGQASMSVGTPVHAYPAPIAVRPAPMEAAPAQTVPAVATGQYRLAGRVGSDPAQYEGDWNCISKVIASNVPQVAAGSTMQCELSFQMNGQGQLLASWNQNGWNPAQCAVVSFRPTGSSIAHKSSTLNRGGWCAMSQDQLRMVSQNQMQGRSHVMQYQNGRVIGTYETVSMLIRQ
jgi:hypothetical protein